MFILEALSFFLFLEGFLPLFDPVTLPYYSYSNPIDLFFKHVF